MLSLTLDPNHNYVIRNDKLQKLIEHIGVKNYRLMAGEAEYLDRGQELRGDGVCISLVWESSQVCIYIGGGLV